MTEAPNEPTDKDLAALDRLARTEGHRPQRATGPVPKQALLPRARTWRPFYLVMMLGTLVLAAVWAYDGWHLLKTWPIQAYLLWGAAVALVAAAVFWAVAAGLNSALSWPAALAAAAVATAFRTAQLSAVVLGHGDLVALDRDPHTDTSTGTISDLVLYAAATAVLAAIAGAGLWWTAREGQSEQDPD